MARLEKSLLQFLAKKLRIAESTITKNVSLMAHQYPRVTPNGRAHLYAQKYHATLWGKLSKEDRQSLPGNIQLQKETVVIHQKQRKVRRSKIHEYVKFETADSFRKGHIDEINRAYTFKCYTSAFILCRKVVENLLIDILRERFPETTRENRELYYDTSQNRFKDFNIILKNFRNKSGEFGTNKKLVERIAELSEGLKDKANDKAHSWYHLLRRPKELDELGIQEILDMIKELETYLEH